MLPAQALPVLYVCLHDARSADDLALRQAAAQALERFMAAASAEDAAVNAAVLSQPASQPAAKPGKGSKRKAAGGDVSQPSQPLSQPAVAVTAVDPSQLSEGGEESLIRLVPRVLYPQLKSQLSSPHQAVRQETLGLLRSLVLAFAHRWAAACLSCLVFCFAVDCLGCKYSCSD